MLMTKKALALSLLASGTYWIAGCSTGGDVGAVHESDAPATTSENGLNSINGLNSFNGLNSLNGLNSFNGLNSLNGLTSINGLNSLNGYMTSDAQTTMSYIVRCALPAGHTITMKGPNNTSIPLSGQLGVAPSWETGACDKDCQYSVSACVLAHVNTSGKHIALWLDSDDPSLGFGRSSDYPYQEGSFFGNIFESPPQAYYCNGTDFALGVVPGRLGAAQVGSPYKNPFGTNAACSTFCAKAAAPYDKDGYSSCNTFPHVVTVYRDFAPNIAYTFKNKVTSTFAEVAAFSTSDGGNVQAWSPTNQANQKWYINKMAPNQYEIVNVNSGKCMEVAGLSTAHETNVQQWSCWGGQNQLWQLNAKGGGWFEVRSVLTANSSAPMCLDIYYTSAANGANIQQYDCGAFGYGAQQWLVDLAN